MILTKAIVRPPGPNFHEGQTSFQGGSPDYQRACAQHEEHCAALERCGLSLTRLEPNIPYPDSTFVEDTAVITGTCAVLCRPGAPSRQGEVAEIENCLAQFFPSLHRIEAPGTVDGGDVCAIETHFLIGISQRTNEVGAKQLAQLLSHCGYTSSFVDIRGRSEILHLKSGFAYLGDNRLVVIESLINCMEVNDYHLLQVPRGSEYAANCVRINEFVLVAAGFPELEELLFASGCQMIALDMTEFQKMDGGLSCLSLRF